jgi:hypothetical protein
VEEQIVLTVVANQKSERAVLDVFLYGAQKHFFFPFVLGPARRLIPAAPADAAATGSMTASQGCSVKLEPTAPRGPLAIGVGGVRYQRIRSELREACAA